MKHNVKITLILLAMFLVTQFIGLYVVASYSPIKIIDGQQQNVSAPELPYGMQPPEVETNQEFNQVFISIVIAFVIAIGLIFLLSKFNAAFFLKLWFFVVVVIALGISLNAFLPKTTWFFMGILIVSIVLGWIKIYKPNFYVHNLTELFIYPGIAAVLVPLLNIWTLAALLVIISIYDMWAVWHSGFMQKLAKYQIKKLNVFSGFFVPYMNKKVKAQIKKIKAQRAKSKSKKKKGKERGVKVNVAILGGGDVIFPIIAAGVALKTFGYISKGGILIPFASLFIILGATLGLGYLFFAAEKKKFYPAMPFISLGIFLGMAVYWFLL